MSASNNSTIAAPEDALLGKVDGERRYGYTPDGKKKRILLNAFDMNGIGHISVGQWQNPVDKSSQKNRLPYWINLAKLLERGKFNALFLGSLALSVHLSNDTTDGNIAADNFGSHDKYKGSHAPAIQSGTQWPLYDPFVIISAMAAVTESLAFGVTACTTFEPPFILAKRFSTLDHITEGRIAWNIVTSWSDNAARAMGLEKLPEHDLRYEMADEYVNLMYKLWEGSWADDAVVKDTESKTYTDPSKVRKIEHDGRFFKSASAHQVDPSPQRTPVLFQAGMSPAGAAFASKHAECIFIGSPNPALLEPKIQKTRQLAISQGRNPGDIKFFVQFTPILGATDEEAREKFINYKKYAIPDGGLALFGGISGIDVSKFPQDEEFPTDPNHPLWEGFTTQQRERLLARPQGYEKWTPRILSEYQSIGGSGNFSIGSGKTVADEMEKWITIADVDGFNIGHVAVPQAWEDVIEFLIPELQSRGWLGDGGYPVPGGTARENLYATPGQAKLRETHPGFQYKFERQGLEIPRDMQILWKLDWVKRQSGSGWLCDNRITCPRSRQPKTPIFLPHQQQHHCRVPSLTLRTLANMGPLTTLGAVATGAQMVDVAAKLLLGSLSLVRGLQEAPAVMALSLTIRYV
ncbi:hypothetical protein FDECE_9254 [Fusarium decemcellulare]|nr:hypothetical protein FDECE_9254 [Fusarium decemcellulare]